MLGLIFLLWFLDTLYPAHTSLKYVMLCYRIEETKLSTGKKGKLVFFYVKLTEMFQPQMSLNTPVLSQHCLLMSQNKSHLIVYMWLYRPACGGSSLICSPILVVCDGSETWTYWNYQSKDNKSIKSWHFYFLTQQTWSIMHIIYWCICQIIIKKANMVRQL